MISPKNNYFFKSYTLSFSFGHIFEKSHKNTKKNNLDMYKNVNMAIVPKLNKALCVSYPKSCIYPIISEFSSSYLSLSKVKASSNISGSIISNITKGMMIEKIIPMFPGTTILKIGQ